MNNKYLRAMRNTLYTAPEKTPYCGTCQKAGLSYEEYTSHYTRKTPDPESEIICPLILSSVCSYCNQTGHWKKYCPEFRWASPKTYKNTFIPIRIENTVSLNEEKGGMVVEEYRSSEEGPPFRPRSPDGPPPWLEFEPKPIKSWAEIVGSKK
jgi:hypothetical protein